ncbi:MAG: energy transducer TonB [Pseudomonadota bacterium]|nr:energy transducer TonB [Pseudomonadota bacterium]
MADTATFRQEDSTGLVIAVALHAAVIALLFLQPAAEEISRLPDRMTVSLATEVSLEATAPEVIPESRQALAPTLSDEQAPVIEETLPEPAVEAPPVPTTPSPPRPSTRTQTTRTPPPERPRSRPDREVAPKPPKPAEKRGGGSRIGDDFLAGQGSSSQTNETRAPAPRFGRAERAALASAITRQLRPHWTAPSGADANKLVSIVKWKLNQDGSLIGRPTCENVPSSVTASNRPQAGPHCERAIRAVQLAAPFNLPEQFYSRWDDLEWQFDRRL